MVRLPNASIFSFYPDSRANRIEKHLTTYRADDPEDPQRWLYVRGPSEAMTQIDLVSGGTGIPTDIAGERATKFNHKRSFPYGIPEVVDSTVELLQQVLTLTSRPHLDFALALDWYKLPDPDVEPKDWPNTPIGELVNRSKYRKHKPAAIELLVGVQEVIETHPLLNRAPYVATVPGHLADGNSFGEAFARTIAKRTGKTIIETLCPSGPREQQKEGPAQSPDGRFEMPTELSDEVLIIDDVYRSGASMNAVGLAARDAGAEFVYGLAAVRTMRK